MLCLELTWYDRTESVYLIHSLSCGVKTTSVKELDFKTVETESY